MFRPNTLFLLLSFYLISASGLAEYSSSTSLYQWQQAENRRVEEQVRQANLRVQQQIAEERRQEEARVQQILRQQAEERRREEARIQQIQSQQAEERRREERRIQQVQWQQAEERRRVEEQARQANYRVQFQIAEEQRQEAARVRQIQWQQAAEQRQREEQVRQENLRVQAENRRVVEQVRLANQQDQSADQRRYDDAARPLSQGGYTVVSSNVIRTPSQGASSRAAVQLPDYIFNGPLPEGRARLVISAPADAEIELDGIRSAGYPFPGRPETRAFITRPLQAEVGATFTYDVRITRREWPEPVTFRAYLQPSGETTFDARNPSAPSSSGPTSTVPSVPTEPRVPLP